MNAGFELTTWQKKQAALLYLFPSTQYLEGLRDRVRTLRFFAEGILNTDRVQLRDKALKSKRWGNRNTVHDWKNNAWPFLGDFQQSIDKSIIDQRANTYHRTGAYQCARGMSEFSMQWMAPEEQGRFDKMFEEAYRYAHYIDDTMDRTALATRWCDFGLAMAWRNHINQFEVLPKLRVRLISSRKVDNCRPEQVCMYRRMIPLQPCSLHGRALLQESCWTAQRLTAQGKPHWRQLAEQACGQMGMPCFALSSTTCRIRI
jgi:hypothetical protein